MFPSLFPLSLLTLVSSEMVPSMLIKTELFHKELALQVSGDSIIIQLKRIFYEYKVILYCFKVIVHNMQSVLIIDVDIIHQVVFLYMFFIYVYYIVYSFVPNSLAVDGNCLAP